MNELLNKIFREAEYTLVENEVPFFSYLNSAFYFHIDFSEAVFSQLKNIEEFEQQKQYQKLKNYFNHENAKGELNQLEKNSSLIVTVKCESLASLEKYQQHILLLEEDEYHFKKYVILYSEETLKELPDSKIMENLRVLVSNKSLFDQYASGGFMPEIESYIFILQLFVKLPFLQLTFEEEDFKSLEQLKVEKLGELQGQFDFLVQNKKKIMSIDFTKETSESEIDKLLKELYD